MGGVAPQAASPKGNALWGDFQLARRTAFLAKFQVQSIKMSILVSAGFLEFGSQFVVLTAIRLWESRSVSELRLDIVNHY